MKKLVVLFVLLGIALVSNNVQSASAKGQPIYETPVVYNGEVLDFCITGFEATSYTLLAGQSIVAGEVILTTDGSSITVWINALGELDDVHIYLYEDGAVLPTKRPIPGQAPFVLENIDGNTASITIPVEEGTVFTLAIHVAFEDDVLVDEFNLAGETAYAANDEASYSGKGAWFYLVQFNIVECEIVVDAPVLYIAAHAALTNSETAWALGEFTFIETGISNKWGWFLSVNTYGVHTFDIYYGAGRNNLEAGTLIGTLVVDYSLETVTITYSLTQSLLEEVQVYVGYEFPTTSAPGQYDYKIENLDGVYTVTVVVNLNDLTE